MEKENELVEVSEQQLEVAQPQAVIELDKKILDIANQAAQFCLEDRDRANDLYNEFLALFEAGANKPADKRELNQAQQMAQNATMNSINLIQALVRLKTGDGKIQIANVNTGGGGGTSMPREKIIELIEQMKG